MIWFSVNIQKNSWTLVMKPSARNRPSSDRVYQGTVVIPYVKGTSEKFRRIGNRFHLKTIFRTKHTLRGALMKTGPVRDAQQTKQCVYSIPCDCGTYYIGETSRLLEVCIKEHKYNLTQGLLKKIRISPTRIRGRPQNMLDWSEGLADWNQHHIQEIQGISPHVSAGPSDQSTQFGHFSHLDPRYHSRSQ
jgi:predicted GIY-YIG superfamily endonuclease